MATIKHERGQPGGCMPPVRHPSCTKQAGQSAVEFALVVTMAIIMFLGMVQFGMYLYGLSIVENAARHAARMGSVAQACPICAAETYAVPSLSSKRRGAGWACVKGGKAHYWIAHVNSLRSRLAENPWIFPPVTAPDGRVLYPGLRRDEVITESQPWPEDYNPDR